MNPCVGDGTKTKTTEANIKMEKENRIGNQNDGGKQIENENHKEMKTKTVGR